jgi:hypothetical protein
VVCWSAIRSLTPPTEIPQVGARDLLTNHLARVRVARPRPIARRCARPWTVGGLTAG